MIDAPAIYGIILNWNSYDDTSLCLESLKQVGYENFKPIVVDNGSSDDSGAKLAAEYPDTEVIFNKDNLGFAGGMNTGIRFAIESGADYIFLLNNDTVFPGDQDLIPQLIKPLIENPNVGVTSPLITKHGTDQIWFLQAEVDEQTLNAKHIGEGQKVDDFVSDHSVVKTSYVPLCAAMIDVDLIEKVGLLNEQYFLYYEDIDYSKRARNHGFEFLTVTEVRIEHKISQSTGDNLGPLNSYYAARNRLLFRNEFEESTSTTRFLIGYIQWLILLTGNRFLHLRIQGLIALFRGVLDGLWSRSGRGPYP